VYCCVRCCVRDEQNTCCVRCCVRDGVRSTCLRNGILFCTLCTRPDNTQRQYTNQLCVVLNNMQGYPTIHKWASIQCAFVYCLMSLPIVVFVTRRTHVVLVVVFVTSRTLSDASAYCCVRDEQNTCCVRCCVRDEQNTV